MRRRMVDRDDTSEQPANDEPEHWVSCVEGNPAVIAQATRRVQVFVLAMFLVFLSLASCAWLFDPSREGRRSPTDVIVLWVGVMSVAGFVALYLRRSFKECDVLIGADFIAGPPFPSAGGLAVARYKDIVRVVLRMRDGQIAGATIHARRMSSVFAGWVKHPAIVVRTILENTPQDVKWRRKGRPFARLSRDEVKALIDKTGPPDIAAAVPPSVALARADDMFPKGGHGRKGVHSVNMVALQPRTPVSHYVGLMLLQMFEAAPATRVLKHSEPLPVLTFREDTAAPPPLEEVLKHLKRKSGLEPKPLACPVDRKIPFTIQGVACSVHCRFDDDAEQCCVIHMERSNAATS